MEFSEFQSKWSNFAECKNKDFMLTSSSMLNLHRVLFCTCIDLNDIVQIDCLAYNVGWLQHLVLCSM